MRKLFHVFAYEESKTEKDVGKTTIKHRQYIVHSKIIRTGKYARKYVTLLLHFKIRTMFQVITKQENSTV